MCMVFQLQVQPLNPLRLLPLRPLLLALPPSPSREPQRRGTVLLSLNPPRLRIAHCMDLSPTPLIILQCGILPPRLTPLDGDQM